MCRVKSTLSQSLCMHQAACCYVVMCRSNKGAADLNSSDLKQAALS
jgi:hypothetical protein